MNGEVVHKENMPQNMASWDLVYHMLRANVDGVNSEYCQVPKGDQDDGRVKHLHGHRVTGLKEKNDKVLVQYVTNDGRNGELEADLVIGADGPGSTVRSILAPGIERENAGYVAIRGTVPENEASPKTQATLKKSHHVLPRAGHLDCELS